MTPAPLRAVIFDLDGLLLDTERTSHGAWDAVAAEWGIPVPEGMCAAMTGRRYGDLLAMMPDFFPAGFDCQAFLDAANLHYMRLLRDEPPAVKPGVDTLLDQLDHWRLPRIVATSSALDKAETKLQQSGLRERVDGVVSGSEVAEGKPAPDIFLLAAERLEQPPGACVVFEDSPPGVAAGAAAGMRVVMVPDYIVPDATTQSQASLIVDRLDDTIDWLGRLILPPR